MGCERSRIGDAFRLPSPAPFVVDTEPAVNRERERDVVRQNIAAEKRWVGPTESSMTAVLTARSLHHLEEGSILTFSLRSPVSGKIDGLGIPELVGTQPVNNCNYERGRFLSGIGPGNRIATSHTTFSAEGLSVPKRTFHT